MPAWLLHTQYGTEPKNKLHIIDNINYLSESSCFQSYCFHDLKK